MSIIMDNRLETSNKDKEEEVRKLQELVKKLELQNEELRSERHALLARTKKESESLEKNETEKAEKETNLVKSSEQKDENETVQINSSLRLSLNLDDHGLSDEETWLFDSPKANPHKDWLREDLNDPSLIDVKKSLVKKLDEITNSPRQSPRHSLYSPSSSSGVLSPESPPPRGEIDTRTFIRPKKRRSLAYDAFNDENKNNVKKEISSVIPRSQNGSKEYLAQSSGSLGSEEEDRLSSASDGSYSSYRIADVEDVNTLARLQEESLKFPDPRSVGRYPGGLNNMRGGSIPSIGSVIPVVPYNNKPRPSAGSSGNSATSSQEDLLTSPPSGLLQPSPRRTPTRSILPAPRRYPSSGIPHPSRENSDMSTPPDSPYTSQQNLEACNGKSSGSRLPSLTRRLGGSDPRLLDHISPNNSRTSSPQPVYNYRQGYGSESKSIARPSRLQTPQARGSRLSAPSPVRIPLGPSQVVEVPYTKGADATRPRPATSVLPRPGSGTRLQTPKNRNPPSAMKFASQTDWREGCY